ncbi:cleavage and polyadenylation specificity factor subunit 2 [Arthroderma uncinatum]|uniref:cleavage and polyadenylation specificity factor subunit 2 n=1 Tax=Arthroderma uncinatum TaxID=74035 RepID=UPI00144A9B1B|nr:cleavage and polyadenylation specificity factor subunit 2 [Arthroderma uncinatum]KAF3490959.1 cleavage and polyadenylation specificity factor subunit 2 [Arthroderma uncinatum]
MFTFTPLLGAQSSSSKASQSILELDGGVKILVDVGWDETFDTSALKELESTSVTASESSSGLAIPSSSATSQDHPEHENTGSCRILLPSPSNEDIARYFSLIHPLKYSQPLQPLPSPFSPPLNGLTITAYNAGHTVGGTIWHIQHGMESIVYAVDWSQARENVIAGAAWFGSSGGSGTEVIEQLRKPTALICSASGGDKLTLAGGRKKRDGLLLDMIRSCVAKGGTVLLPTDSSARVLEIAYVLEHAWREASDTGNSDEPLKNTPLYLAGKKAHGTMRLARSMLEWMDENIVREFEGGDGVEVGATGKAGGTANQQSKNTQSQKSAAGQKSLGPFTFKHLNLVEHKAKLDSILESKGPKVILSPDTSLEWGLSKHVLKHIAESSDNLIIMTEPLNFSTEEQGGSSNSYGNILGCKIWKLYEERKDGVALEKSASGELLEQVHSGGKALTLTEVQRSSLDSDELLIYQQYLATQNQLQNTAQVRGNTTLENAADAMDDASSSSESEDSESEQQGKVLNFSVSLPHSNKRKMGLSDADLGVNILLRKRGVHDYDVRGKKGRERMFPYVASKKRGDQYGEFIRPEEYLRAEEREEAQVQDPRGPSGNIQSTPGQKRRWDKAGSGGNQGSNKRRQLSQPSDDNIPSNELSPPNGLVNSDAENAEASEEDAESQTLTEGPSKATIVHSSLALNARLAFVDFAGLHDKRSLEMLIPLIQPRNLILIRGTKEETLALAAECRNLLSATRGASTTSTTKRGVDVFTPSIGDTVDASVDTNAWMVRLSRPLVRRLMWQNVSNLGVVALVGNLQSSQAISLQEEVLEQSKNKGKGEAWKATGPVESQANQSLIKNEKIPVLDILPASLVAATRSVTKPLHVGDLRLSDLRKLMQSSGHSAEFRGEGTLLVDGFIAVRKAGAGKIEVEGAARPSPNNPTTMRHGTGSFLAVKQKIYESLAVVSGHSS